MSTRSRLARIGLAAALVASPIIASPLVAARATATELTADCQTPADTVDPQVTSLKLTKKVSVATSGATVHVTADAVDTETGPNLTAVPGSGVKSLEVGLTGPRYGIEEGHLRLTSGSATNGVWQGEIKIHKDEDAGTWYVDSVTAIDADGNQAGYYGFASGGYSSPNDPRLQSGWQTTVSVQGTPRKEIKDSLKSLSVNVKSVNSVTSKGHLAVTATVAGPDYGPHTLQVAFNGKKVSFGTWLKHKKGHEYAADVTVPRWLGDGDFTPAVYATYFWIDYESPRIKSSFKEPKLKVVSGTDKTPPKISALKLSSTTVNTTKSSQRVTLTAKINDTQSGVSGYSFDTSFELLAAGSDHYAFPFNVHKKDGAWTGSATFPRCIGDGTYYLGGYVSDRDENSRSYNHTQLAADHFSSQIKVTSKTPGDTTPPDVTNDSYEGPTSAGTIQLAFTEPVLNVTANDLSVYQESGKYGQNGDFADPLSITHVMCYDAKKNVVDCSGDDGSVLSMLMNVSGMVSGESYLIYANQHSVVPQITDRAGNPIDSAETLALRDTT